MIKSSGFYISVNQDIPCAMIINELITNSLNHAFRDRAQGEIQIYMNNSDDNTVLLKVKDDGDGISKEIDLKDFDGLGLEMVEHLVVGQLKGEIRFNHDDGTDICIEFNTRTLDEN